MTEDLRAWHQLDNEPSGAYAAFKVYLYMLPEERSWAEAYRRHTGNEKATVAPPYFTEWGRDYAWRERALAYDRHIQELREEGQEDAIREEAKKQSEAVESRRNRYRELMTLGYEAATTWLQDPDNRVSGLRSNDVVQIMRLYFEAEKADQQLALAREEEPEWTEEDERGVADIVAEVESLEEDPGPTEDGPAGEEEVPSEDPPD